MPINTTGHDGIDSATAEIAVALRKACPVLCGDQDHYDEAVRLRDAIMDGTRALDSRDTLARDDTDRALAPAKVVDQDGDEWGLKEDGLYHSPGLEPMPLDMLRRAYGPLYAAVAI